ncbi:MAG: ABC transporter ATP-binding protein, partial [Deltaproteobacteria bacterium]|nr:ABC transporter ATP-binding protein [Deltaproteobacteria bacterium]
KLGDRGYIIDDGKIVYHGDINDLKKNEDIRKKYLMV